MVLWDDRNIQETKNIPTTPRVVPLQCKPVLSYTPALVTSSTATCSVIGCHGAPSALGGCTWLWYRQRPSHPAPRISTSWLCTGSCNCQGNCQGNSTGPVEYSALYQSILAIYSSNQWASPEFLCVFPSHSVHSLLFSSSPEAALGFCSLQQVTHSWQQHSQSDFLLPGVSAPWDISNPDSELSGDIFGLTVYPWLSVEILFLYDLRL